MEIQVAQRIDNTFVNLQVIDIFESLLWTERYCGVGEFELLVEPSYDNLTWLTPDKLLKLTDSDCLMLIESAKITTDIDTGNKLLVTGRSLESILKRRIVWTPILLQSDFVTGINTLIENAITNPADPLRKINNFVFTLPTDPAITALTLDYQAKRGTYLEDIITDLCKTKGLGYRLRLLADGTLDFTIFAGADRSYSQIANPYVVFSPDFDNLLSSEYTIDVKPLRTITLVEGETIGATTYLTTASAYFGLEEGLDRREMFTSATDIKKVVDGVTLTDPQYTAQLVEKGEINLLYNDTLETFDSEVDPNGLFKYGVHFFLGDIVQTVDAYGKSGRTRITEIVRSQDQSGIGLYPTFTIVE